MYKELYWMVTIFVVSIGLLFIGVYHLEEAICDAKSVSFPSHEYSLLGGCMVEHKGMLLPLDNIRGFD